MGEVANELERVLLRNLDSLIRLAYLLKRDAVWIAELSGDERARLTKLLRGAIKAFDSLHDSLLEKR